MCLRGAWPSITVVEVTRCRRAFRFEEHGETAHAIRLGIEYDPQPPFDAGALWKAPAEIRDLVRGMLGDSRDRVLSRN